jgi:hypothetical protein
LLIFGNNPRKYGIPEKLKPSFMPSTTNGQQDNDVVRRSSLYKEFQAERDEILRHKWIESEKAGHDIGFERALTDWIIKHRSKWRKSRQMGAAN